MSRPFRRSKQFRRRLKEDEDLGGRQSFHQLSPGGQTSIKRQLAKLIHDNPNMDQQSPKLAEFARLHGLDMKSLLALVREVKGNVSAGTRFERVLRDGQLMLGLLENEAVSEAKFSDTETFKEFDKKHGVQMDGPSNFSSAKHKIYGMRSIQTLRNAIKKKLGGRIGECRELFHNNGGWDAFEAYVGNAFQITSRQDVQHMEFNDPKRFKEYESILGMAKSLTEGDSPETVAEKIAEKNEEFFAFELEPLLARLQTRNVNESVEMTDEAANNILEWFKRNSDSNQAPEEVEEAIDNGDWTLLDDILSGQSLPPSNDPKWMETWRLGE